MDINRGYICPGCNQTIEVTESGIAEDGMDNTTLRLTTTFKHPAYHEDACVEFYSAFLMEQQEIIKAAMQRITTSLAENTQHIMRRDP